MLAAAATWILTPQMTPEISATIILKRPETVLFVDLLRHFPAHIGQVQEIVAVHCQESPVPKGRHRMAHAGLCDLQVPGDIHRAHHAFFLLEYQYGLQVILAGSVQFFIRRHCTHHFLARGRRKPARDSLHPRPSADATAPCSPE